MLRTTTDAVRALTPDDLPALRVLADRDPHVNLFVRHRADSTRLDPRWLGGPVWGWFEEGRLTAACHAGANLVPVQAGPEAVAVFADQALADGIRPSSIVGPRDAVLGLWQRLAPHWGPARSPRLEQPFLEIARDPDIDADPRVRRVGVDEIDVIYPACVAMFTEEVGVDPERGSRHAYRARVSQLVAQGWSFAIIEDGQVLFKAEVGATTAVACQIQGVWVHPDHRGSGIAAPALAGVVREVRRSVAPVVTLYVNDHNVAARRTYDRIGFEQTATFASILL